MRCSGASTSHRLVAKRVFALTPERASRPASHAPDAIPKYHFVAQGNRLGQGKDIDVVSGVPTFQARLVVHAVLGTQRQVNAAHALVGTNVADAPLDRHGAVHAETQLAYP